MPFLLLVLFEISAETFADFLGVFGDLDTRFANVSQLILVFEIVS